MKSIYRIVGEKHHRWAPETIARMKTGAKVWLVRDPKNAFELTGNAVKVFVMATIDGTTDLIPIGFILAKQAAPLAKVIDVYGIPSVGIVLSDDPKRPYGKCLEMKFLDERGPHVEVEEPDPE